MIKRRTFLKKASIAATTAFLPSCSVSAPNESNRLRIAQIGVGGMGRGTIIGSGKADN